MFGTGFGNSTLGGSEVSLSYVTGVPDVGTIPSSQLSVVFKSLLKRDSTTKEKALSDLIRILSAEDAAASHVGPEMHWAWVQLYPKLSIDTSRSVRQLAHKSQGILCRILGKTTSKHLKESVGPWMIGLYDADKAVVSAAETALDAVFPTAEKKEALYRVFEQSLLEFILQVVSVETVSSLSDERFVTKDEAEAKYYRTVRAAVLLFNELINKDTKKYEEDYLAVLKTSQLWKCAYSSDAALSCAVLRLPHTLIAKRMSWAEKNIKEISHCVIYRGFEKCQPGAFIDLLQAVIVMTACPLPFWINANGKKRTAYSVFLEFVRNGSRRSGKYFWPSVLKLLSTLPPAMSPYNTESPAGTTQETAAAVLEGIKKEMVVHLGAGWGTYLAVVEKMLASKVTHATDVLKEAITVMTDTLILQDGDTLDRDVLGIVGRKLADLAVYDADTIVARSDKLLDLIVNQKKSTAYFKKYLFTTATLVDNLKSDEDRNKWLAMMSKHVTHALDTLDPQDDFKIHALASILTSFSDRIFNFDPALVGRIGEFLQQHLGTYVVSESAAEVLAILKQYALHNRDSAADEMIRQSVELAFNSVVKLSNLDKRSSLFPLILKEYSLFKGRTKPIPLASEYLLSVYSSIDSWEITNDWDSILFGICSHGIFVSEDVALDILKGVASLQLVKGKNTDKAIWTFNNLLKIDQPYFMKFIENAEGRELVSKLWQLSEDHPEAEGILAAIEANAIVKDEAQRSEHNKTFESLIEGLLSEVERSSVESVDISVQRGQRLLDQIQDENDKLQVFRRLLFHTSGLWAKKLDLLFNSGISAGSLAVSNPLGGGIFFLDDASVDDTNKNLELIPEEHISMSIFSVSLIANNRELFDHLPGEVWLDLMVALTLISAASTDHAFLAVLKHENGVGKENFLSDAIIAFGDDVSGLLLDFLQQVSASDVIRAIASEHELEGERTAFIGRLLKKLWTNSISSRDAMAYYSARVLAFALEHVINRPSVSTAEAESLFKQLSHIFNNSNNRPLLGGAAVLVGFQRFMYLLKDFDQLRNRFASDLIGGGVADKQEVLPKNLNALVYLNILISSPLEEHPGEVIPMNRLLMCFKSILQSAQAEAAYTASYLPARIETTKLLWRLLPAYRSALPASSWQSAVELLEQDSVVLEEYDADVSGIGSDRHVALEYYTLKLFNAIAGMQEEIADLSEVWMEKQEGLYTELLEVLFRAGDRATAAGPGANKARVMTNIQLQRAVSQTPLNLIEEPERLYGLLAAPSFDIQRSGYVLLHELIPTQQEERSIELQLTRQNLGTDNDNDEGKDDESEFTLPPELISLLLETPVRGAPAADITRYLWSWKLIYDHFTNATYDLKKMYIEELRESGHLDAFLNYMSERVVSGELESALTTYCTTLGEQAVYIKAYGTREQPPYESADQEIDALMIHLYYQSLVNTGTLVKLWCVSLKRRATSIAIEKFTERYLTPVIVDDELSKVDESLKKNSALNDDAMTTTTNRTLKEVKAQYTIDDQTMEIVVRMPPLYPLRDIQVEGIRRVGVKERQWRAWLLASQAIGTSQNGSIVDTLEVFKRNVSLHFEGVAECAICYSILHQDHSLPSKTCGTCKNKFHANCLYKWFKSASSSTCPLCRTNFSFRR